MLRIYEYRAILKGKNITMKCQKKWDLSAENIYIPIMYLDKKLYSADKYGALDPTLGVILDVG